MQKKELGNTSNNSNKYLVFAGVLVLAFALILFSSNRLGDTSVEESTGEFYHTGGALTCTGGPGKQGSCPPRYLCSASVGGVCKLQRTTPTQNDCKESARCTSYSTLITTSVSPTGQQCPAAKTKNCANGCLATTSLQPTRCIEQCKDASGTLLTNSDGSPSLYSQVYSKGVSDKGVSKLMQLSTLSVLSSDNKIKIFTSSTGDLLKEITLAAQIRDFTLSGTTLYVIHQKASSIYDKFALSAYDIATNNLGVLKFTQDVNVSYNAKIFSALPNSLYFVQTNGRDLNVDKYNTATRALTPFVKKTFADYPPSTPVMDVKSNGDFATAINNNIYRFTATGQESSSFNLSSTIPSGSQRITANSLAFEKQLPQNLYVMFSYYDSNWAPQRKLVKLSQTNQLLYSIAQPSPSDTFATYGNINIETSSAADKSLFVADSFQSTVWKLDTDGKYVTTVVKNQKFVPENNTYAPDGMIPFLDLDNLGNVFTIQRTTTTNTLNKYSAC